MWFTVEAPQKVKHTLFILSPFTFVDQVKNAIDNFVSVFLLIAKLLKFYKH